MIYELDERRVTFAGDGHFVAPSAQVIGDVWMGHQSSVWFGAVVRGDNHRISIGAETNIQDGAVLHTDEGIELVLAEQVTVGHQAMLHGCTVGAGSLIGIQAVVLNHARIGASCLIGAQTLVPEGMVIPDGVLVLGSPARIRRDLNSEEKNRLLQSARHYCEKARLYAARLRVHNHE